MATTFYANITDHGFNLFPNSYVRYYPAPTIYSQSSSALKALPATYSAVTEGDSGYTPGFHSKQAAGKLIAFTRHSKTGVRFEQTPALFTGNRKKTLSYRSCTQDYEVCGGNAFAVTSDRIAYDTPSMPSTAAAIQEAAAKAHSGAMMVLVEMVESPKTVSLVRDSVQVMKRRVNQVSRETKGKYKHLYKSQDIYNAFLDTWLEARYGWNQLVYSTADLVEAYRILGKPKDVIVNGKSVSANTAGISCTSFSVVRHSKSPGATAVHSFENSTTVRGSVSCLVSRQGAAIDTNLAALAWEIVPYSFVVDWFVNFGDLLRAHWPNPSIKDQVACYSVKRKVRHDAVIKAVSQGSECGAYHSTGIGKFSLTLDSYDRYPVSEIPFSLTWRPRLGWMQCVDLIALVPGRKQIVNLIRRIRL